MIKAVLFDMDGTLIDTEKYYRICWPKAMAHFGYEMSDEQALSMRSLGQPFAPTHLKEMFADENLDYPAIRAYRKELMEEYLAKNGIEIKRGAVELLNFLKEKKIRRAVATATDMERTERYLKQIGLYPYFDEIISASMVKLGKPRPDVYLYVCEKIGRKPEECMAVEDSPNGVNAAYQAGCHVTMVPDLTPADEEVKKMADHVVPDLRGLLEYLK